MKRIIFSAILLSAVFLTAIGRTMNYRLHFDASDFELKAVKGDTSIICSSRYDIYPNYGRTNPELPVVYVSLLLPADAVVDSLVCNKADTLFAENVLLNNGSVVCTVGSPEPEATKEWYAPQVYASSVTFKGNRQEGGYRMATFKVMPFTYDASTRSLMISDFELTLELSDAMAIARRGSKRGARERAYVRDRVWNKADLQTLYPETAPSRTQTGVILKDRYIIVTNDSLKEAFQPLIEWKRKRGLDANIVTTDSLPVNTGSTLEKRIWSYLRQQFEGNPNRDDIDFYVLLGGDVNIIPTKYYRSIINGSYGYIPTNILEIDVPCDQYYACVSDSIQGDDMTIYNISGPSLPSQWWPNDLLVGRASVRTLAHVTAFVNKIIKYESDPPLNWGKRAFFMGGPMAEVCSPQPAGDSPEDALIYSDSIINQEIPFDKRPFMKQLFVKYNNLGYTGLETENYMFTSPSRVKAQLRSNYSVVSEMSHGGHNRWSYIVGQGDFSLLLDSTAASSLISSYPKVIVTSACHTNSFDVNDLDGEGDDGTSPCLGELFMQNARSGVVAYVGSSREGFSSSNYTFINSNKFQKEFFHALYDSTSTAFEEPKLGLVVSRAKNSFIIEDDVERRLWFSINTLGDPEMTICTDIPHRFNISMYPINYIDSISIVDNKELNIIPNTSNYLFNRNDTGEIEKKDSDVSIEVVWSGDSIEFTFIKKGYVTKCCKVYSTAYLSGMTLSENDLTCSDYCYILVGRNVVDDPDSPNYYPSGNVIVNSGKKLTLEAKKKVVLERGFQCNSGGAFKISITNNN